MKKCKIYLVILIGAIYMLLLETGYYRSLYNFDLTIHLPSNFLNYTQNTYEIKQMPSIITITSSNTSKYGTTFGKIVYSNENEENKPKLQLSNQDLYKYGQFYDLENILNYPKKFNAQFLKASQLLIISYFRSGSSFLGDLLQQQTSTFYTYEPFIYKSKSSRLNDSQINEAVHTLDSIFNCHFDRIPNYTNWVKDYAYLLQWNRYLWHHCSMSNRKNCYMPKYLNHVCLGAKNRLVKSNRFKISFLEEFITKTQNVKNLKVIFLIRDPRAIFNSRKSLFWCMNSLCTDINHICKEMEDDVEIFLNLSKKYPNLIIPLRFEDLALNPFNKTKDLFQKLNRPMTRSIQTFLRIHIKTLNFEKKKVDPYSTLRDSQKVPLNWIYQLSAQKINQIQMKCKNIMITLGYKPIDTITIGKGEISPSMVIQNSFPLEEYVLRNKVNS